MHNGMFINLFDMYSLYSKGYGRFALRLLECTNTKMDYVKLSSSMIKSMIRLHAILDV